VDGSVLVNCDSASGATFPLGTTTVNCSATDSDGNTARVSFKVSLLYSFTGFFQPVDNPPTFNVGKAGIVVPVSFGLSGNMGLNVFASGYPQAVPIPCDPAAPVDTIEQTVSVKSSVLTYDASQDRYRYAWKTDQKWRGTCQQLVMRFKDGTEKTALFKFTLGSSTRRLASAEWGPGLLDAPALFSPLFTEVP
jgi:HYR domain